MAFEALFPEFNRKGLFTLLKMSKRALFIGRWQPFHKGHMWMIDQKLGLNIPVLIAVRDCKPDAENPLTCEQTVKVLSTIYKGQDVKIIVIPDIESVNYSRNVGYEVNEFSPPSDIGKISATEIRRELKNGLETWKEKVDSKIHFLVEKYLLE